MSDGKLKIDLEFDSQFLSHRIPVEIRDSRLNLIHKVTGRSTVNVPGGLYKVTAVMPDGLIHERLAEVPTGGEGRVSFTRDPSADRGPEPYGSLSLPIESMSPDRPGPILLEHRGVHVEELKDGWRFTPEPSLFEVPFAVFRTDSTIIEASLPVNPEGHGADSACDVLCRGEQIQVDIAQERSVATAVVHLERSRQILRAVELLDEATDLLQGKYFDPTGAALGGLILHRLGRLGERGHWVANLANDFPWLPDGQILKASLDRDRGGTAQASALETVLRVAGRRCMYADAFSLLLQLLRRWPGGARVDERRAALRKLATSTSEVDWGQIALVHRKGIE